MLVLIGKEGGQSILYCSLNKALGPTGRLVMLSEIQGSRQKRQVLTFDVNFDWETRWPVDTLLQLEYSLGPPLGSLSSFLRSKGLVEKKQVPVFSIKTDWETGWPVDALLQL